ncbi:hypothetical protein ACT3S9_15785 [Pseudoalteromonas sp. AOP31-A2-14]|uniref:hypothetical protein n=1 Tax=Pseudoalteromonas sp. AOP31-A2-14 TaxID=3457695 RepID=UPI00403614A3
MTFQTQVLAKKNGILIGDYFRGKQLNELGVEELAYIHLNLLHIRTPLKDFYVSSSLRELEQTLTASFGNKRTKQYVPLMTSFAILDQLGSLYSIADANCNFQNGIKKALATLTHIRDRDDIESLVTLRNGLLHDGSLISHNVYRDIDVIYRMTVGSGKVITPPKKVWDGIYRDSLSEYVTLIDLKELQAVVLKAIKLCAEHLENSTLIINCTDEKEFFYKYLFSEKIVNGN